MVLDPSLLAVSVHRRYVVSKPIDFGATSKVSRPEALSGAPQALPLLGAEGGERRYHRTPLARAHLDDHYDSLVERHDVDFKRAQSHIPPPDREAPCLQETGHFRLTPTAGRLHWSGVSARHSVSCVARLERMSEILTAPVSALRSRVNGRSLRGLRENELERPPLIVQSTSR
jgi:hypothetical protein